MVLLRAIRKFPCYVDFCLEGIFCEKLLTYAMKNGINIMFPKKERICNARFCFGVRL